jgi:hypothetical protein
VGQSSVDGDKSYVLHCVFCQICLFVIHACFGDAGMNGSQLKKMPNQECPVDRAPRMNVPVSAQDSEQTSWDAGVPATSPDSSSGSYDEAAASAGAGSDWAMVCHQFQNMVHQQCIVMEMLQVTISFPFCLFQFNLDLLKHGNPGMRHLNNRSWLEK